MSVWRCTLCQKTVVGTRWNALRHLRIHKPIEHHRCDRCGVCVRTSYNLRRHKTTCSATHGSLHRNSMHCNHRRTEYDTLPKNYVPDEYLICVEPKESKKNQKSACLSTAADSEDVDYTSTTSESIGPKDSKEVGDNDVFQYFIGEQCVRVARRENDTFHVCVGMRDVQSEWPCPRCKLPFRTPQGLASHLGYLYEGF